MEFRRITQLALLCSAICSYSLAQVTPGTGYLFQFPAPGSSSTRILGYLADTSDLNADLDVTGPAGPQRIIATPDGQRVYVLSANALQVFNASLQTMQPVTGIIGPIRNVTLTPDGKYLMVAATQFYIISTNTNSIVSTNLGASGAIADIAVSSDSRTAWILRSSNFFNSITPLNLVNLTAGTSVTIPRQGETITLSPQGKLYVPSRNSILEIDASTLAILSESFMSALPGRLHFNQEGTEAYFLDQDTQTSQGYSILSYRPNGQQVSGWPADVFDPNRPKFSELLFAGNNRIFGFDRAHTTLWEITTQPLGAAPVNMSTAFDSSIVFAAAVSNEFPSARYLYVLTENSARPTLERVNLSNGTLQTFANALVPTGALQYVGIPPQSGASQIIKHNDGQVLAHGGTAKTLYAYVTDSLGRAVYNQTVSFTLDAASSAATLANSSTVTNAEGYVRTTATIPDVPGTYNIVLTAGTATATFTITVPAPNTGGGGGSGEPTSLMSIVRGDGQLIQELDGTPDWAPLTVKIVDAAGKPIPGVQVDFTQTQGLGVIFPASATTDDDGLAAAHYFTQSLGTTSAFQQHIIRADSPYGSVEFLETVYRPNQSDRQFIPITTSAQTFFSADVRRGDVIPNFFQIDIHSTLSPQIGDPIPGVGLRVADGADYRLDGPGTCVNDTKSDQFGIARCDFKASCSLTVPTRVEIMTGELFRSSFILFPKPGSGQTLKYVSGNNQTGLVGQVLPDRLTASIIDNCGDPVQNQSVTWKVTQGSATLTQTLSTSNTDGNVSTQITLGQAVGIIKVTATLEGSAPVEFTLTSTVNVTGISLTSGGGQIVLPGAQFANPVVFTLRASNGNPVGANLSVNFSISGGGTLGVAQATTNAQGQAQTTVTAGATPGTVIVTATYQTLSASASLTIRPPTLPLTAASFTNAASGATGLVPCGLAIAVGAGLAPNVTGVVSGSPFSGFGPFDTTVAGVSLRINGILAPILAVSNQGGKQQVNFQTPCETTPGNATVVITVNGVETTVSGVPAFAVQPGLSTFTENGKTYPIIVRAKDNSLIRPNNLAPTGETLYLLYVTGLGLVTPNTATNQNGLANQTAVLPAFVGVNDAGVPTQPARYAFGQIGLYYVEFTIPKTSTAPAGTVLLTDAPFALGVINNGQFVFGNPVRIPGVKQGE